MTSVPTLSFQNVGVSVEFQFGLSEDETIYSDFFTNFENAYGFYLPSYIHDTESDQSPALKTSIDSQEMQQIICFRHFLVSLGTGPFFAQYGKHVVCTSSKVYKELKAVYEASWSGLSDESCGSLKESLNRAGLIFENEKIIKIDINFLMKKGYGLYSKVIDDQKTHMMSICHDIYQHSRGECMS